MATTEYSQTIQKALNILNAQDWHYYMCDYGYDREYEKAKSNMRYFVEVTNALPSEIREVLRNLWIETCDYMQSISPVHSPTESEKLAYAKAKEEAMAFLNTFVA